MFSCRRRKTTSLSYAGDKPACAYVDECLNVNVCAMTGRQIYSMDSILHMLLPHTRTAYWSLLSLPGLFADMCSMACSCHTESTGMVVLCRSTKTRQTSTVHTVSPTPLRGCCIVYVLWCTKITGIKHWHTAWWPNIGLTNIDKIQLLMMHLMPVWGGEGGRESSALSATVVCVVTGKAMYACDSANETMQMRLCKMSTRQQSHRTDRRSVEIRRAAICRTV